MKKLNIFLMMALALVFTSCEEEWVEALPQATDQPALFTAEDFSASNQLGDVVLTTEQANEAVTVAQFNSVSNLPEGATVEFAMQMAKNEDFSDAVSVAVSNSNNVATATMGALQEAYVKVQGRNPEARTVNVRYAAYVVNGTEKARVNGIDTFYGQAQVVVTPCDPGFRMESAYYFVWAEDPEALADFENVIPFGHSDKDVYDDTKFSLVFESPEGVSSYYWVVAPQSVLDAKNFDAVLGAEEGMEYESAGFLYATTNEDYPGIAICQEEAGKFQFDIDMYCELENEIYPTYSISPAFDFLYTPGNSNGWNQSASNLLGTKDYVNYQGFAFLNGEFKFSNAPDWNHTNYGNTGTEGELSTDGGAGNLKTDEGLYWAKVNVVNLTYTLTKIESLGLIGDFNGWGAQLPMTAQIEGASSIKWVGEVTLTAGQGFKFRCNDDWGINLGGDNFDELTLDGANLSVSEDGTYEVVLDLSTLPYKATVTKK